MSDIFIQRGKIRNKYDDKDLENDIMSYVTRCFEDAFKSESREYDESAWSFWYIIVRDPNGTYYMIPNLWCKYGRVQGKVYYRLQRNIHKKFGIIFEKDADYRYLLYNDGKLDPNFTDALFKIDKKYYSLSIFDNERDLVYNNGMNRYKQIICYIHNITIDEYNQDPEKYQYPYDKLKNWKDWEYFKEVVSGATGRPIDRGYKYICSSNVERIE